MGFSAAPASASAWRLPGKLIVGNGNWFGFNQYFGDKPQGWLESANGTMVEGIEPYYNSPDTLRKIASQWLAASPRPRYLLFVQNALSASGARLKLSSGANPNDSLSCWTRA